MKQGNAANVKYRWVVLFAATGMNFLTWGVVYAVGVLFYNWVEYFDESRGLVAIAAALPTGIGCLFGPIFGYFIERFGTRKMGSLGGVIMAGSHIASAYAGDVYYLCVVYGVLVGIGAGLANLSAALALNCYFEKDRTLAEGIMTSGVASGTFVFAFVQQMLINKYGWRSAVMVIGAICLHLVVFSLLTISPSYLQKIQRNNEKPRPRDVSVEEDIIKQEELKYYEANTIVQEEKETFSTRSIILWKNKVFLLILASDFITWLVTFVPYVHLSERARLLGMDKNTAAWLISTIGIAGAFGRPGLSALANYFNIHPFVAYGISHIVAGLANLLTPIFQSKLGLFTYSVVYGLLSCDYGLMKASVSRLLGKEWFGIAFSWMLLFEGLGIIFGPPIAGWIYDLTESYDIPFYVSGVAFIISALLAFLYFPLKRRKQQVKTSYSKQVLLVG